MGEKNNYIYLYIKCNESLIMIVIHNLYWDTGLLARHLLARGQCLNTYYILYICIYLLLKYVANVLGTINEYFFRCRKRGHLNFQMFLSLSWTPSGSNPLWNTQFSGGCWRWSCVFPMARLRWRVDFPSIKTLLGSIFLKIALCPGGLWRTIFGLWEA